MAELFRLVKDYNLPIYIYIIYVIYLILYIIYMWLDMGNNGLLSIKVDIDRILIIWDVYLFAYLSI